MEKFCPRCSRAYGENATTCDVDGERLVILTQEPSLVGHVLDDKYTLRAKIGEGGMGSVYLAEQVSMGRQVAIKVLRREFSQNRLAIKRFLREARAASKLAHPNTITVYDFGQSNDGLLYLVMELLTGRPLNEIIDEGGAMPVKRAVHIMAQVCDSLAEAHAAGITHRDLKPENIFIQQKVGNPDHVKVLDFGIAKMAGEENTQATATGMICGTPAYMSPEQAMGRDIDGRSDIYGLGILFYEMVTDQTPFDGETPMEVMLKHINEPPPDIYQQTRISVPVGIQAAVAATLAKQAEQRPANCQKLKQMLLDGLNTEVVAPPPQTAAASLSPVRRGQSHEPDARLEKTGLSPAVPASSTTLDAIRPPRRARAWVAFLAVLVLAVGGGLAFVLTQGDDGQAPPAPSPSAEEAAEASEATGPEAAAGQPTKQPGASAATAESVKVAPVAPTPHTKRPGSAVGALAVAVAPRSFELLAEGQPTRPEQVVLTIRSQPDGAQVYLGGELIGTTPADITRDKGSGRLTLTLKKERYRDRTVHLDTAANVIQSVELKRRWQPKAARTPRPSGDPKRGTTFGTF